jgi:hypothetical protein
MRCGPIYLLLHFGKPSVNLYQIIRHRIADDSNLQSHRLHNLKQRIYCGLSYEAEITSALRGPTEKSKASHTLQTSQYQGHLISLVSFSSSSSSSSSSSGLFPFRINSEIMYLTDSRQDSLDV